jgi:hypothetical protein
MMRVVCLIVRLSHYVPRLSAQVQRTFEKIFGWARNVLAGQPVFLAR